MQDTIDNASLHSAIEALSAFRPFSKSSAILPPLLLPKSSSRYAHASSYKQALERLKESRALLRQITDSVTRIEKEFSLQEVTLQNSLSPVNALPVECLNEIFLWLAAGMKYCDAGRTLSRVCASWRSISMSLPALWTHVLCDNFLKRMEEVTKMRATSLPLRITMSSQSTYPRYIAKGEESRGRIASLRYVVGNRSEVPESWSIPNIELRTLYEIIIDARPSLPRPLPITPREYPAVEIRMGRLHPVVGLQVFSARILIDRDVSAYSLEVPRNLLLGRMTLEVVWHNIACLIDAQEERIETLHLSQIIADVRWTRQLSGMIENLLSPDEDAEVGWKPRLQEIILDRCFPNLAVDMIRHRDTKVTSFQIVLPDLRLSSPDMVATLRLIFGRISTFEIFSNLFVFSGPADMIFSIILDVVAHRRRLISRSGEKADDLKLRMVLAPWCVLVSSQVTDIASRWQSIRSEFLKTKHKSSKLNISLDISASLATEHTDILQRCFVSWSLLPDDAEPLVLTYA